MLQKIDFRPGEVIYNDFNIDPEITFEEQRYSFNEDLFQVEYAGRYVIDIGWYPAHKKNGNFQVRIVKNCDWENLIYLKKAKTFDHLYLLVEECTTIIKDLLENEA